MSETPSDGEFEPRISGSCAFHNEHSYCDLAGCSCPCHLSSDVMDADDFADAVQAERERQVAKGYDRAHDTEHGIDHLLVWAYEYALKGKPVKSAAMIEAARELLAAGRASVTPPTIKAIREAEKEAVRLLKPKQFRVIKREIGFTVETPVVDYWEAVRELARALAVPSTESENGNG